MSLAGAAVVAIWNDITDEGRENFYEWHNREHMPERLGIPGFLRGRRYVSRDARPAYFTLYEVRDTAVLASAGYLARLNSPTPWTTDSVRHFRNVARSLCRVEASQGRGSGGWLGTLRFDCDAAQDADLAVEFARILADLAGRPGIVATHTGCADLAASTAKTAEQAGRPANAVPRWVVMVEGSTETAIRDALADPLSAPALARFGLLDLEAGSYGLQFDLLAA